MTAVGAEFIDDGEADGTMSAGAILGRIRPEFFNGLWAGDRERALQDV